MGSGDLSEYGVLKIADAGSVVNRIVLGHRIIGKPDARLTERPWRPEKPLMEALVVGRMRPGVADKDMHVVCVQGNLPCRFYK